MPAPATRTPATPAPVEAPRSARAARLPAAIPAAIAAAWALALVAQATGRARLLHHDALIEGHVPLAVAVAVFLLSWQAMVAAMMLPSSLPLVRLFATASAGQERPRRVMAAFDSGGRRTTV